MYRRLLYTLLLFSLIIACATTVFAGEISAHSARAALSGNDAIIYDFLEEHIKAVAAGEQSQTIFQLPVADLGLTGSWTAADLGVSTLLTGEKVSAEAITALQQKLAYNSTLVMQALIYDHPYEMFWYDKTTGTSEATKLSVIVTTQCDIQRISFHPDSYLTYTLAVAQEYASGLVYGDPGLFCEVSAAKLTNFKVQAAAANAAQIVAANAGKSDYEKLVAYKEAICSAVSYNNGAAADNSTPYGNPWQLIYVFDDDPSTNVVCEGYAKAFKYLCDLSTFEEDIACYLVSGVMSSGSGTENHMWNIVSMGNGQHYLVDVTNCDEHTVGAPDWLFLAGDDLPPEYDSADYGVSIPERDLGNGYIALAAQVVYAHDGLTQSLWGETGILELSTADYPKPACSHSFTTKPSNELVSAATCTSPAYYKAQCDLCDAVSDTVTVAVGPVLHSFTTKPSNDLVSEATCASPAIYKVQCDLCDAVSDTLTIADGATLSHSFTTKPSNELVSAATCTSPAYYKAQCDLCDAVSDTVKVAVEPATGHTPGAAVEENRVAPTCNNIGSYDSVVYCITCSSELSRTHNEVPATGNHTDTDNNSKCDSCDTVLPHTCNLVEIGHQEKNDRCTSTFRCTLCGKTETSSFELSKDVLSISTLPQEVVQTMTVVIVSYENGRMTGIQMVERPVGDISITVQGSELSSFFLDLNTLVPVMDYLSRTFD